MFYCSMQKKKRKKRKKKEVLKLDVDKSKIIVLGGEKGSKCEVSINGRCIYGFKNLGLVLN